MTSRFCRVPRLIRSPLSPQSALVPVRTLTFSPPNSNILSSRPPTEPVTPATEPGQPAPPPQHTSPASKVKSIVNSVLHGTERGNRDEVADTHSKLLARGKYVHEMQIHNVKPEAMDDYIKLVDEHYPRIANSPEFQVKLFGSWTAEFGELDQAVHLWEYNNYPGYHETQDMLRKDVQFESFERQLRPMLRSRSNQMLLEFAFWQGSPPTVHNGIYELRSYLLKPGRLLEWETEWRRGLEARRKFAQPVGAWFSQLGALNYVHHMWVYPDLQIRKESREKAWQVDGWAQTVYNTVNLIDNMQATIMRPLPFSPMK